MGRQREKRDPQEHGRRNDLDPPAFRPRHTNGLYAEVWDIAVSTSDPDILLAATLDSPGPVTGDYPSSIVGVYKSTDSGSTFALIADLRNDILNAAP